MPSLAFPQALFSNSHYTFGTGISYTLDNEHNGLYQFNERTVAMPVSLRIQFNPSVSATVSASFVSSSNERVATSDVVSTSSTGLGDAELSFTVQSNSHPSSSWPLFSLSGGVVLPAGESASSFATGSSGTGKGVRSVTVGIGAVKVLSPVVLFANVGFDYSDEYESNELKIKPGQNISFGFGFSFFVNDEVTFTSKIGAVVESEIHVDGIKISGTGSESIPFSFGLVYTMVQTHSLAPSFNMGLGGDADSSAGLSLSYLYKF